VVAQLPKTTSNEPMVIALRSKSSAEPNQAIRSATKDKSTPQWLQIFPTGMLVIHAYTYSVFAYAPNAQSFLK